MDINDIRSILSVTAFVSFLGIACWAWSKPRQRRFAQAAQLPLIDDEIASINNEDKHP